MDHDLFDIDKNQAQNVKPTECVNINVGVLGHVDSGKTSICRVLTEIASTASLDKSPQSKQRGITLDLGFSSFLTRVPVHLQNIKQKYLQFTLVDCPGHASLIRTIIGGAQIIDLMFLVVDINKGIQTQTAECIIIAEMFINKLIIVLNKVDCLEDQKQLVNKTNSLKKVFGKTKFGQNVIMIPYSTKEDTEKYSKSLKNALIKQLKLPQRSQVNKKFTILIDHCFKIKGKGSIITGTVTQGRIKIGDEIQICELQQKSKIKSIEMFRKPLNSAKQGDRVAMLMTHLQAQNLERGVACLPGAMKKISKFVLDINKVRLYKRSIKNKAKFHIISGHQTVMGEVRLFYSHKKVLDLNQVYLSINDFEEKPKFMEEKVEENANEEQVFAIISLQKEMYGCEGHKIIGYKYDIENDEKECRIAFHGSIHLIVTPENVVRLYKDKQKKGVVDRIVDNYTVIVKDLFDKNVNIQQFVGKEIKLQCGDVGKIDGAFGKSGKIRVIFKQSLSAADIEGIGVSFAYKKWYN